MLPCRALTAAVSHADSGEVNKAVESFTRPASHQIGGFFSFKSKWFSVFFPFFFGGVGGCCGLSLCFLILNSRNLRASCLRRADRVCALSRDGDLQSLASNFHTRFIPYTHTHFCIPIHFFSFSISITFLVFSGVFEHWSITFV